ncbi:MAG: hypothetical protein ACLRSH_01005 [Turicibacter sp.]
MANITNYLNKIKTAVYGKDVRGAIHDAIKQVYDDASVNHDNANMEVKMARGTHNTLNDRLDNVDEIQAQTNAQLSQTNNNVVGVSVKNFGAKGDGVTDDTQAIIDAINSNHEIITMDCDCKISRTIVLDVNKKYDFKGKFVVSDKFIDDKVIYISNVVTQFNIDKLDVVTEKFYKQDRHTLINTTRTRFDGVVVEGVSRRVNIKELTIVGITSRALVVNDGYEFNVGKIDIWGSNIDDSVSIKSNLLDKLMFRTQDERYTVGVVINANDAIIDNAVVVGFNIGMSINSSNIVSNYHPWAYKSTMIYGLVVKGQHNVCSNIYLDTVGSITERTGAGIYEWKIVDGADSSTNIEYNRYVNISAIKTDSEACMVELGDDDNETTSYSCMVTNIVGQYQTKIYKLNGSAKGNPNLSMQLGNNFNSFYTSLNSLTYTPSKTFNEIISEIINNHMQTHYNMVMGILFTDTSRELSSKLPPSSGLYNQQIIVKIENYNNRFFRCVVRAYGYPHANTLILDMFRQNDGSFDVYTSYGSGYTVLSYQPTATDYPVGSQIFFKNRPAWRHSDGYWVYADGTRVIG